MGIVFFSALLGLLVLLWLLATDAPAIAGYVLLPLALLTFAVSQNETWLWSRLEYTAFILFLLLGIVAIRRYAENWFALAFGVVMAVLSSFTHAGGFVMWVAVLPGMWLAGWRKWQHYVVWIAAGVVTRLVFLINYTPSAPNIEDPTILSFLMYVPALLSATFTFNMNPTELFYRVLVIVLPVVGLILAALNMLYLRARTGDMKIAASWVALIVYGGIFALLVGWSRSGFGLLGAQFSTRYIFATNMFWVGIITLGALTIYHLVRADEKQPWYEQVFLYSHIAFNGVLLYLFVTSSYSSIGLSSRWSNRADEGVICTLEYLVLQDDVTCFETIHNGIALPVQQLANNELSTFSREFDVSIALPENEDVVYVPRTGTLKLIIPGSAREVIITHDENTQRIAPGTVFNLTERYTNREIQLESDTLASAILRFEGQGRETN
jgi:hypothetical protein